MEENKSAAPQTPPVSATPTTPIVPSPDSVPELTPQPIPAPIITHEPPHPPVVAKKSNLKLIIMAIVGVLLVIILIAAAVMVLPKMTSQPEPTLAPTPVPTPEVLIPKPDEMSAIKNSVEISDNTVAAAKADGKYYLTYQNKFYEPAALDSKELTEIQLEDPTIYTWHGLVDVEDGAVFDFAQLPKINPGFAFVMRSPASEETHFELFYFAYDELSPIATFDVDPSKLAYRIPKFYSINDAGTLGALHMYDCWECERHYPQTMVVNFISKETQVLGPTSVFNWGTDENFEYKDYRQNVDPATLPLKTGSFKF